MTKISRKWLILEHYIQTAECVFGETTLRVWKPKTMGKLPAYSMREMMDDCYQRTVYYEGKNQKATWGRENPDWGLWDAQVATYFDPRRKTLDIYICSLLMRPFSEKAREHYGERMGLEPMDRLLLMWDSRQFDAEGNYPPALRGGINYEGSPYTYEDLFHVIDEKRDIEDSSK